MEIYVRKREILDAAVFRSDMPSVVIITSRKNAQGSPRVKKIGQFINRRHFTSHKIIFSLLLAILLSACATNDTKCGPFNAYSHDCMIQRLRDVDAYRDLKKE